MTEILNIYNLNLYSADAWSEAGTGHGHQATRVPETITRVQTNCCHSDQDAELVTNHGGGNHCQMGQGKLILIVYMHGQCYM